MQFAHCPRDANALKRGTAARRNGFCVLMKYLREIVHLAMPILLANMAMIGSGVVDTAMLGHYGRLDLAAMSIAVAIYSTVYSVCIGFLQALQQIFAQAYGSGDAKRLWVVVVQGLLLALGLAILAMIGVFWCAAHLEVFHVIPGTGQIVAGYMRVLAIALPLQLTYRVFQNHAQISGEARRVMAYNLSALGLKAFLSWLLIFGSLGLPELGARGAALASVITSGIMLPLFLYGGRAALPSLHAWRELWRLALADHASLRAILRVGLPSAATCFVDVGAYTSMAILAANFGAVQAGAHQIVSNFNALLYFVPASLAAACSILVSHRIGAGRLAEGRELAWFSLRINALLALVMVIGVLLLRRPIAALYTSDLAVGDYAVVLLGVSWLFLFFDAQLVMMVSLLRSWSITIMPMCIYSGVLLTGAVGGGWLLASRGLQLAGLSIAPMAVKGFWVMATASSAVVAIILVLRLWYALVAHKRPDIA
jgi:MATE family multidrug resistance protein